MNPRDRRSTPCRAQADKQEYNEIHAPRPGEHDHLTIRQAEVAEILTEEIPGEYGTFKKEHEGAAGEQLSGEKTDRGCKNLLRRGL